MLFPASSKYPMLAALNGGVLVHEHIIMQIHTSSIPISNLKNVLIKHI